MSEKLECAFVENSFGLPWVGLELTTATITHLKSLRENLIVIEHEVIQTTWETFFSTSNDVSDVPPDGQKL